MKSSIQKASKACQKKNKSCVFYNFVCNEGFLDIAIENFGILIFGTYFHKNILFLNSRLIRGSTILDNFLINSWGVGLYAGRLIREYVR